MWLNVCGEYHLSQCFLSQGRLSVKIYRKFINKYKNINTNIKNTGRYTKFEKSPSLTWRSFQFCGTLPMFSICIPAVREFH